jgi:hypothetical protein
LAHDSLLRCNCHIRSTAFFSDDEPLRHSECALLRSLFMLPAISDASSTPSTSSSSSSPTLTEIDSVDEHVFDLWAEVDKTLLFENLFAGLLMCKDEDFKGRLFLYEKL